jgi:hypothetical protein
MALLIILTVVVPFTSDLAIAHPEETSAWYVIEVCAFKL